MKKDDLLFLNKHINSLEKSKKKYIIVEATKLGVRVMLGGYRKISCLNCLQHYCNKLTSCNYYIEDIEAIKKAAKFLSNQNIIFASTLEYTPGKGWELHKIFPHYRCEICNSNYLCDTVLEENSIYNTDYHLLRKYDRAQLKSIIDQIPIGAYSFLKGIDLYRYEHVYITRILLDLQNKEDYAIGRSVSKEESVFIAVLEGLERLCLNAKMLHITSKYYGEFNHLKDSVHPATIIKKNNPYSFRKKNKIQWIASSSLNDYKTLLIPSQLILFEENSELKKRNEQRFYSATSNGTAIGSNENEALLYAILEHLERFFGLKAWNEKKNLERWKWKYFKDNPYIMDILDFFIKEKVNIDIINTQTDLQLPSTIWLHLVWEGKCLNCLGSGLSPDEAVYGALQEAFTAYKNFSNLDANLRRKSNNLINSNKISSMADHILYYLDKLDQFSFIQDIPFYKEGYNSLTRKAKQLNNKGLTWTINKIMSQLDKNIFGINLTPKYLKMLENPLYVVKVFIEDSLEFNFGKYDPGKTPHPFV